MSVKIIRDKDNTERVLNNIAFFNKTSVKAGITQRVGQIVNDKSDTKLVVYAHQNEFGIGVPERSFLRSTFDENQKEWFNAFVLAFQVTNTVSQNNSLLFEIGKKMEKDIKIKIKSNIPPRNAPATLAQKEGTNTLIDTGLMLNNIDYEVRTK